FQEHDWGTVAKFEDPAGNLIAFKDDSRFEQQVAEAAPKIS
ncbi:MAG: lactoylglutathione lyase, partial [Planctomycetota bacterium]